MLEKIKVALANIDIGGQVSQIDGGNTDLTVTVSNVLSVVFAIVGIIAVVMVVIGGVNYVTSQGDSAKIQKAKNTIMYGIIGMVIALLAFAIVNFVLNGLMGKT